MSETGEITGTEAVDDRVRGDREHRPEAAAEAAPRTPDDATDERRR